MPLRLRIPRPRVALTLPLLVLLAGVGCKKKAPETAMVIGVQSEPMGGIVSALHIVTRVGGKMTSDDLVKPPNGSLVGFPQPWEKKLMPTDDPNAEVDVDVEAIGVGGPDRAPHLKRHASTHFQPGRTDLLRVGLESRCVVYPVTKRAHDSTPGPLSGPTCTPPATCIHGLCQSGAVHPSRLEPYAADWPNNAPDMCRPRGAGTPSVRIGTGQTGYTPLAPDQVLQAEAGPQGGHHIWIAVRVKDTKQAGTTTRISAVQPGTGVVIPPSTFAFTFERDEGGYCKLYGLRYQLDNGGIDYKQFLGKSLDVTTTVVDPLHGTATSTAHIMVAPTLLNP